MLLVFVLLGFLWRAFAPGHEFTCANKSQDIGRRQKGHTLGTTGYTTTITLLITEMNVCAQKRGYHHQRLVSTPEFLWTIIPAWIWVCFLF